MMSRFSCPAFNPQTLMQRIAGRTLCAGLMLGLSACGFLTHLTGQSTAVDSEAAVATSGTTPSNSIVTVPTAKPPAPSVLAYRQQLAEHIQTTSGHQLFEGVPPNPLYAIVVLTWQIDSEGKVNGLRVLRSASHAPSTDKLALESVRRAQVFPKPSAVVLKQVGGKRVTVLETWLFKDATHFQLRTLAQNQASE